MRFVTFKPMQTHLSNKHLFRKASYILILPTRDTVTIYERLTIDGGVDYASVAQVFIHTEGKSSTYGAIKGGDW